MVFSFQKNLHYNSFHKTIYNELNWKQHFLTQGVLLDEFLHILYESKVHCEKCFILLYVSQKHFEWCKVEHNETIYILYLDYNFFFFFWKKTINWEKLFFWLKKSFLFLTLKVWNLFEKMRLTSKMFPHNFKSFIGYLKVMEKQKWATPEKNGLFYRGSPCKTQYSTRSF